MSISHNNSSPMCWTQILFAGILLRFTRLIHRAQSNFCGSSPLGVGMGSCFLFVCHHYFALAKWSVLFKYCQGREVDGHGKQCMRCDISQMVCWGSILVKIFSPKCTGPVLTQRLDALAHLVHISKHIMTRTCLSAQDNWRGVGR